MPNKVLLKKSSVAAKVPLTTDLDYGELALNYADGKLYFKNSSNVIKSFTLDDNVVTLAGTQTLTNKTLSSPTISGNITGDVASTGVLKSLYSVGDEGGEISLSVPQTNTTLAGSNVIIDIYQNRLRIFESGGSNRGAYIDLTAASTAVGSNLLTGGGGGGGGGNSFTTIEVSGQSSVVADSTTDTLTLVGSTGLTITTNATTDTITFTNSGVTSVNGVTGAVTASNLLTALLTVDGSGSGLDADLLDGQTSSYFLDTSANAQTKLGGANSLLVGGYTNTYSTQANSSAFTAQPMATEIWHDLFALCKAYTTTYETYNGTTWSAATLNKELFAQKENQSIDVANGSPITASRWTFTDVAWGQGRWLVIGHAWSNGTSNKTVLVETGNGTTWTTRHQSTYTDNASSIFHYLDSYSGDSHMRITITRNPSSTAEIRLSNIKLLTARPGDQGRGKEFHYPYSWDGNQNITTGGDLTVTGNLTVNGTTTNINTTNLVVEDKNVILGDVTTPSNTTADGGGITLKGATDKTFNWINATSAWTSSEHMDLASGKAYYINGTSVLNATTLGSGVTGSSLTSVGTIGTGTWQGTVINSTYGGTGINNGGRTITLNTGNLTITAQAAGSSVTIPASGTLISSADTGTVTSTMIADGTIVNADINASAAIAVSKLASSTISGVTLGNNLNALTIGTGLSGTSYNGSSAVTIAIDSTVATLTGTQTLTNKTFTDSTTLFQDETDNTKKLAFQLSGITTATTRTLTIPDASGTIALTSNNLGAFGSTTSAQLAGIISDETGSGSLVFSASPTFTGTASFAAISTTGNVGVGGDLTITGNLTVNGTTTTVNSTTISVDDKNIELGSIATPTDTTADGGGITLKGTTDKTLNWVNATSAWTSSEDFNLLTGKVYEINGTTVLSATTLGSGVTASSLTSVGTITSGTWSASFGAVSGANLTNLTAGNLSGTIPSAVLANSTVNIGTTAVALNRASANLALTGISSIQLPGSTSGAVTLQSAATAGTTTITLPATTGTVVTTGDTGTVTNAMLAGSIATSKITGLAASATTDTTNASNITSGTLPNARLSAVPNSALANSSVTINGQSVSLGGTATVTATATNALTIGTGLTGTSYNGSSAVTIAIDSTVATLTGTQTLTNKTLTSPVISTISNTGTLTLPTSTDTLVGRATTDTLTNKTLSSAVITGTLTAGGGVGTAGQVLQSTGTGVQWATAAGGGGSTWIFRTANYTASSGDNIIATTSSGAFTITLPAAPTQGAQITIADGSTTLATSWQTNNLTIARNGNTIEGLAEDLVMDIAGVKADLIYNGSTWLVFAFASGADDTLAVSLAIGDEF